MKIKKINQSAGVIANIVNSLDSNSTIDALSAAAGKELNEKILANTIDFAETEKNNSIEAIRIMRNEEIVNYANWQVMNTTLMVCVLDEDFISTIVNETATVLDYFTGVKLSDLSTSSLYGSLYYYFLVKDGKITNLKPTMPIQEVNNGHYYNIIRYATITEDISAQTITFDDLGSNSTNATKNIIVDWLTLNSVDSLLPIRGDNRIIYTPKNENHPATKKYVDDLVTSAQEISFVIPRHNSSRIMLTALQGMTFQDWIDSDYYDANSKLFVTSTGLLAGETSSTSTNYRFYSVINPSSELFATEKIMPIVYTESITGTCCFEAGSQVLVSLKGETKNIEDLKVDDQVVVYDEATGKLVESKITEFITHEVTDVAEIYLKNNTKLRMNAYHPILTVDGYHSITNYEELPTLTEEDIIITKDGEVGINRIIRYQQEEEIMYNLSIENENHNFIVNGIVVHNATGCV